MDYREYSRDAPAGLARQEVVPVRMDEVAGGGRGTCADSVLLWAVMEM